MVTALEKSNYMSKKWYFYSSIAFVVILFGSGFKPYNFENLNWLSQTESDEVFHFTVPTATELEYRNVIFPQTGKTYAGFKQALAFKESQGKYHLVNSFGYMGKYQFGMGTLRTIGVRDSLQFLRSPALQERAFNALAAINKWELRKEIEQYEGQVIQGVAITESGLLAAAHLGGAGSVKKFLRSNGQRSIKDGFGTSIKSYIQKFGGYDTSPIITNKNARVK